MQKGVEHTKVDAWYYIFPWITVIATPGGGYSSNSLPRVTTGSGMGNSSSLKTCCRADSVAQTRTWFLLLLFQRGGHKKKTSNSHANSYYIQHFALKYLFNISIWEGGDKPLHRLPLTVRLWNGRILEDIGNAGSRPWLGPIANSSQFSACGLSMMRNCLSQRLPHNLFT